MTSKLFAPAENRQAYLKAGIMGFQGSGKSFTAALIAIGLVKHLKEQRPVYFLDTETGADFLVGKFKEAAIPLLVAKTRSFVDLLEAVREAETAASVMIIDSITHFWLEVVEAYRRAHNRTRLQFQDWDPIKSQWSRFTELYVNSKVHIIMCGRAGDVYEYVINEDTGKKELGKVGTKMQVEKNLGYEPCLALEMEKAQIGDFKKGQRVFTNRCYVLKDKFDIMDGMVFENPTFETFLPHIQKLNIGGEHMGVVQGSDSSKVFAKDSAENFYEIRKQKEIFCEEIQGELVAMWPGRAAEDIQVKTDIVFEAFGTRSWTAVQDMDLDALRKGLTYIRERIKGIKDIRDKKGELKLENEEFAQPTSPRGRKKQAV